MANAKVSDVVLEMVKPIAEKNGVDIWDVEYVKEGADWYLRVLLDHPDGININQCEAVNRELGMLLDETDPIPHFYYLEVSSAGIERHLRRNSDFLRFIGSKVLIRLFSAEEGKKEFVGTLKDYADNVVTIETEDGEKRFDRSLLSLARLWAEF